MTPEQIKKEADYLEGRFKPVSNEPVRCALLCVEEQLQLLYKIQNTLLPMDDEIKECEAVKQELKSRI
jgi:hypothetical protein